MWSFLNKIDDNLTLSDITNEETKGREQIQTKMLQECELGGNLDGDKENLESQVKLLGTVSKLHYGKEIMSYIMSLLGGNRSASRLEIHSLVARIL